MSGGIFFSLISSRMKSSSRGGYRVREMLVSMRLPFRTRWRRTPPSENAPSWSMGPVTSHRMLHCSRKAGAARLLVRVCPRGGVAAWRKEGLALEGEEPAAERDPGTRLSLADGTYPVDPEASLLAWVGRNANKMHHGTVGLAGGEISILRGNLSGVVEVDMRSIKNIDLEGDELQPVLIAHVESDDFFFVKRFPSAKFAIKSARPVAEPYLGSPTTKWKAPSSCGACSGYPLSRHHEQPRGGQDCCRGSL